MRKFRVELDGRNFLIPVPGNGDMKHGFFTNRFVEADDESKAESLAVEALRKRPALREMLRNTAEDPPRIHLRKIVELSSFDGLPTIDQGLVWYLENRAEPD
jgi:hypothetical protein